MFGKLEEFDMATGKDLIQYIERMEYYFQANKITEGDTKRAILISSMGEKALKLMRSLISPAKPNDKSLKVWTVSRSSERTSLSTALRDCTAP